MSRPLVQIDIAPSAYGRSPEPVVVQALSEDAALVALFDGSGSWGCGMEAAEWARRELAERWRRSVPDSIAVIANDITAVSAGVPDEFRDDFGCEFSGVAVLLGAGSFHVTAAGLFCVYLVSDSALTPAYRPRMLVDQLIEQKQLSPAEVDRFAHQDICLNAFLADRSEQPLRTSGPHEWPSSHVVLVAHERLVRLLAKRPPASWIHHPAAELQRMGTEAEVFGHPTIVIRGAARQT